MFSRLVEIKSNLEKINKSISGISYDLGEEINDYIKKLQLVEEEWRIKAVLRKILVLTAPDGRIQNEIFEETNVELQKRTEALRNKTYSLAYEIITTPTESELLKTKYILKIVENMEDIVSSNSNKNIIEYIEHDEWGLALETICAAIRDENIRISEETYNLIQKVGLEMKMEEMIWKEIKMMVT